SVAPSSRSSRPAVASSRNCSGTVASTPRASASSRNPGKPSVSSSVSAKTSSYGVSRAPAAAPAWPAVSSPLTAPSPLPPGRLGRGLRLAHLRRRAPEQPAQRSGQPLAPHQHHEHLAPLRKARAVHAHEAHVAQPRRPRHAVALALPLELDPFARLRAVPVRLLEEVVLLHLVPALPQPFPRPVEQRVERLALAPLEVLVRRVVHGYQAGLRGERFQVVLQLVRQRLPQLLVPVELLVQPREPPE